MQPWVLNCLLIQVMSSVVRAKPALGEGTLCSARGVCYTLHASRLAHSEAKNACKPGVLTSMKEEGERQNLLGLLLKSQNGELADLGRFWIGLSKHSRQCVVKEKILRGFQWESGSDNSEVELWATEPKGTCTSKLCVALQSSANRSLPDGWQWKAMSCKDRNPHICRHEYGGVCREPDVANVTVLLDRTLYRPGNESVVLSPPETKATAMYNGGERNVTLICQRCDGRYQWGESEKCADQEESTVGTDYTSPSEGAMPGTESPSNEAVPGSNPTPYSTDLITATQINSTQDKPPATPSAFPYVLVPVTIAAVALGILILFVIGIFKFCFKSSQRGGSKTPKAPAPSDTDSEANNAPGAENGEMARAHSDRESNEMSTLPAGARPGSQGL